MTKYNPQTHHRRSIRLRGYDYSQGGCYHITICTTGRQLFFDQYAILKHIVHDQWYQIPARHPNITLDEFIIMPNHIHGIITVNVGAGLAPALNDAPAPNDVIAPNNGPIDKYRATAIRATARDAPTDGEMPTKNNTIGKIIGEYKSLCITEWLKYIKHNNLDVYGKFWQRNYYEHIIRDETEMNRVRQYIVNNPLNWKSDDNYVISPE